MPTSSRFLRAALAAALALLAPLGPAQPRLVASVEIAPQPPDWIDAEQRQRFGTPTPALADIHPNPGKEICFLWAHGALQVFGVDPASPPGAPRFLSLGYHEFATPDEAAVGNVDFGRIADFNGDLEAVLVHDASGCVAWGELGERGFASSRYLSGVPRWRDGDDDPAGNRLGYLEWLDFAQDITGDGFADIVAIDAEARLVLMIQRADGAFVALEPPALPSRATAAARFSVFGPKPSLDPEAELEGESAPDAAPKKTAMGGRLDWSVGSWTGPLAFEDFDRDGYPDLLALIREGSSVANLPAGTPDPIARVWRGQPDANHPSGWGYAEPPTELCGVAGAGDPGSYLLDLNADGVLDRVSLFSNYDVSAPRTRLAFYDGAKQPRAQAPDGAERIVYKAPTTVIRSRDPVGMSTLSDFNRDGRRDAALTHFTYLFGSVSEMADSFLKETAEFALRFHEMGADGLGEEPSSTLRVTVAMEVFGPGRGAAHPLIVGGDYDGDGREDFALRTKLGELAIYGLPPRSGESTPPSATIAWDHRGPIDAIEPADLNGDGRDELILSSGRWTLVCFFQ